jgi:deoxyinosine 3'endonuclease (endonuclease V)
LSTGIPAIGVSNSLVGCEVKGEKDGAEIIREGERVGKVLLIKEGSKPMYISPGNQISVDTSYTLCKSLVNLPHKRPEPLHLVSKYAKRVRKELA